VPLDGEICSQLPPESVLAAVVQLIDPCPVLRIPKLCVSGTPPCDTRGEAQRAFCESTIVAVGALNDKVTGMLMLFAGTRDNYRAAVSSWR